MEVVNGKQTEFWRDKWISKGALKDQFPDLDMICQEQAISVRGVADRNWNFNFRRWLSADQMIQLNRLRIILHRVTLRPMGEDIPKWTWNRKCSFSVKSI